MKLEQNNIDSKYVIQSYNEEGIQVNDEKMTRSFIIMSDRLLRSWQPDNISVLKPSDLEIIVDLEPEIILLGSGNKLSFPEAALIAPVTSKNIGFEVMDTYAACRCYSILISEGRNVAAALILEK